MTNFAQFSLICSILKYYANGLRLCGRRLFNQCVSCSARCPVPSQRFSMDFNRTRPGLMDYNWLQCFWTRFGGFQWIQTDRFAMDFKGPLLVLMDFNRFQWIWTMFHGFQWTWARFNGLLRNKVETNIRGWKGPQKRSCFVRHVVIPIHTDSLIWSRPLKEILKQKTLVGGGGGVQGSSPFNVLIPNINISNFEAKHTFFWKRFPYLGRRYY